MLNIRTGVETS